jgi:hypothetical protein
LLLPVFFTLFMLGGFLVVDVGMLANERRQAQAAADFAALAGALELPYIDTDPDAAAKLLAAENFAREYARTNGYDADDPEVTFGVTTSYLGSADKIEVRVGREHRWLFGDFFGLVPETRVTARAVAQTNAHPRDIMVVLDRSGSMCIRTHGLMLNCPNPAGDPDRNGRADWEPFDTMRVASQGFSQYFTPSVGGVTIDRMGLVAFSDTAATTLPLTSNFVGGASAYAAAITAMRPSGYTNVGYGITRARQELAARGRPEATKIIVVLSDGIANLYRTGGTDASPTFRLCASTDGCASADNYVLAQAQAAADAGFAIYTIGYTDLAGVALLRQVAAIGAAGSGGEFFDVANPEDLDDTFRHIADLVRVALLE